MYLRFRRHASAKNRRSSSLYHSWDGRESILTTDLFTGVNNLVMSSFEEAAMTSSSRAGVTPLMLK